MHNMLSCGKQYRYYVTSLLTIPSPLNPITLRELNLVILQTLPSSIIVLYHRGYSRILQVTALTYLQEVLQHLP